MQTLAIVLAAGDEPSPLLPHTSELIVGTVAFVLLSALYIAGALADDH